MPNSAPKVPYFKLSGTPEEIGFQHGQLLKDRIVACYQFYTEKLIVNPLLDFQAFGQTFLEKIRLHFPHYAREIEAIAEGSGLFSWQIALLNARTELFIKSLTQPINECTLCFFRNRAMLGENWDWMKECEELIVLLEIERPDGHRILMLAEPGIIGKIGLNSAGLGVGLNILSGPHFDVAIPVHVLLRAALDAANLDEVRQLFHQTPVCAYSNVIIADATGNYLDYELMGSSIRQLEYGGENPIHTNHYLSLILDESANPMYESSLHRMERATSIDHEISRDTMNKMKQILLDQAGDTAICSDFKEQLHFEVGTVSSLIMDLPKRRLWVTRGNPLRHAYQCFYLS